MPSSTAIRSRRRRNTSRPSLRDTACRSATPGEFFIFTDWAFQGDTNFFLYEAAEFQSKDTFEGGLRIGYSMNDGQYEVAVFGRNITDEENVKGAIDFNNLTGFDNEPRVIGVSFRARFD